MRQHLALPLILLLVLLAAGLFFFLTQDRTPPEVSPVTRHGQLSVQGNRIVDDQGEPVSLGGVSLFWSNDGWGGEAFYNSSVVHELVWDWNISIIRAAMGVETPGGYLHAPESNLQKVEDVINAAIKEGIYVIIDWHSHHAEEYPDEAVRFFERMAHDYGDHPNVIYEIYNEPLPEAGWSDTIKPYAERVIRAIRAIDPNNLILVGTSSWSQDVEEAALDPIVGFDNIAYSLHFYAGTHGAELRDKAVQALDEDIALMVSEWGSVNADGDGDVALGATQDWMAFLREHQISQVNWALNDKEEGASILKPEASTDGGWSDEDLTESGRLVRQLLRDWPDPSIKKAPEHQ